MAVLPSPETALQQHIRKQHYNKGVVIGVLSYMCTHYVYYVHIRLSTVL